MVYITIDGRISVSGLKSDEGDLVRTGTLWLVDGTRLILPVDHNIPTYSITSTLHDKGLVGDILSYNIKIECTNNVDPGEPLNVSIPIPAGFTLETWNSDNGTYNTDTSTWTPIMEGQECSINIIVTCTTTGSQSQTVTLNTTGDSLTSTCTIQATDTDGDIYYTTFTITDTDTLGNLQNGEMYTLLVYGYVDDSTLANIHDGVYNNRIMVDNGETYIGERVTTEGSYELLSVVFEYDDTDSIDIILYGQYQSISTTCDDRWAGIGLYQGYQTEYSAPVNLLSDPSQLLDDTGSSNITLDSNSESATYVYDVTVPVLGNALDFFTGAELTVNSFANSNSSIEVYLENGEGVVSNTKSSFISTTGKITFGDMADLWGLGTDDVEGQTIQVVIKFTNTTRAQATFSYSNIQLKLYYVTDETGSSPGFTAKGIHSMNYQLFVQEVEIPEGPDRDIGTVNFPLSDGETIVNNSLKSKELKVNFVVWGNTLDEAKLKLRNISKWLTNDRNSLSIPEPYDLIFDFEDDMSYQVILGEPIDTEIQYTSILCEATFTVESGVALTTEQKITGPVGSNDGIVKVKPLITFLCDGSASITITDNETTQTLSINTTITDGTIITIDCENRTVTDENGTDYTTDVDIESIWFHFTNDYNISSAGGIVQSVAFNEGY